FQGRPEPAAAGAGGPEGRMWRFLAQDAMQARLHRWRMNLVTGATSEQDLSDSCTEFGTINGGFGGRPYRYTYAATNEPGWFLFNGLVKHDTLTGREESYQFEPGVFCSEVGVAPRVGGTGEDDAYLVTLTVDMNRDLSECVVFRASDVGRGPIARAQRPRQRPVEGAADDLVLGSGLGDRAHRAAAADVPPPVRRGVRPGHALPGLRPAGRDLRCARHVRPERRLRAVGAVRHHPAPLRGRLAGPRPGAADHRADRQPLVGGDPGRRVPRRPAVHRHAADDGRPAYHRLGPAAHVLPDGRAGDGRGQGRLRPGRVPAHGQGPGLLPACHGDARLGRPVVPRPRGTRHLAYPHHLRRRVPPRPALLRLRPRAARLPDPGRRRPAQI